MRFSMGELSQCFAADYRRQHAVVDAALRLVADVALSALPEVLRKRAARLANAIAVRVGSLLRTQHAGGAVLDRLR